MFSRYPWEEQKQTQSPNGSVENLSFERVFKSKVLLRKACSNKPAKSTIGCWDLSCEQLDM